MKDTSIANEIFLTHYPGAPDLEMIIDFICENSKYLKKSSLNKLIAEFGEPKCGD